MICTVSIECTTVGTVIFTVEPDIDIESGVVVAPFTSTAILDEIGAVVFSTLENTSDTAEVSIVPDTNDGGVRSAYIEKVDVAVLLLPAKSVYLLAPSVRVVVPVVVGVRRTVKVDELVVASSETVAPFVAEKLDNDRP